MTKTYDTIIDEDHLVDKNVREWLESERAQRLPRQETKWPETMSELFGTSDDNSLNKRALPLDETGNKGYNGYNVTNYTNIARIAAPAPGYTGQTPNDSFRLFQGMSGDEVKTLQRWLNKLGYTDGSGNPLAEDGEFGFNTLAAVNKFKDAFLPGGNLGENRGIVDPTTWDEIYRAVSQQQRKEARETGKAAADSISATPMSSIVLAAESINNKDYGTSKGSNGINQSSSLVDNTKIIIFGNEGNYVSINPNDNGSLSIGQMQWHGNRARDLLIQIINANPEQAERILGSTTILDELGYDWSNRTLNDLEKAAVKELLKTPDGIAIQDTLALTDVQSYIEHAKRLGITDPATIAYFADLENQGGAGISERIVKSAGGGEGLTLDEIYAAALFDITMGSEDYLSRRDSTYEKCKGLINTSITVNPQPNNSNTGHTNDNTIRLEKGSSSNDVKTLQRWLNELGYTDENGHALMVDGEFGAHTLAAVNKFKDAVLPGGNTGINRGVVGSTTWDALYKAVSHQQRKEARQEENGTAATTTSSTLPAVTPSSSSDNFMVLT